MKLITRVCKNCKKIYVPKTPKQEFCDKECKYNYYNVYYICDTCGKEFLTKRTLVERVKSGQRKHLYCPNCTNKGQGSTNITKECCVCGKTFVVIKAFAEQKYCSSICFSIGNTKYADIKCPICNKTFHPKSDSTVFCSNECKIESTKDRIKCNCQYCGKEFERKRSEYLKNKFHYCSKVCHYLDLSWSEHDKEVLREKYGKISNKEILLLLDGEYTEHAIRSEAGRLGLYSDVSFWSVEEEKILLENYSKLPMSEVCNLLPTRTRSSILGKAKQLGVLSYHYLINTYSEEEDNFLKSNYLIMNNKEMALKLHRSENGIAQHLWNLGLKRPTEKGKYDTLANYVREKTKRWRYKIKTESGWTCCVTGEHTDIVLHHCRSFNLLFAETIDDLKFTIKDNLNDYTQQELDTFVEHFLYLQDYYGEYCCVTEKIHKLFHSIYGFGNNTMEQWKEFVENYNNSKYELSA